ncbi:hypothetical protein K438DRAFT_2130467, partial [Mycena galopus ATCC 62051]
AIIYTRSLRRSPASPPTSPLLPPSPLKPSPVQSLPAAQSSFPLSTMTHDAYHQRHAGRLRRLFIVADAALIGSLPATSIFAIVHDPHLHQPPQHMPLVSIAQIALIASSDAAIDFSSRRRPSPSPEYHHKEHLRWPDGSGGRKDREGDYKGDIETVPASSGLENVSGVSAKRQQAISDGVPDVAGFRWIPMAVHCLRRVSLVSGGQPGPERPVVATGIQRLSLVDWFAVTVIYWSVENLFFLNPQSISPNSIPTTRL